MSEYLGPRPMPEGKLNTSDLQVEQAEEKYGDQPKIRLLRTAIKEGLMPEGSRLSDLTPEIMDKATEIVNDREKSNIADLAEQIKEQRNNQ